jgi:hypothetical protein
MYMPLNQFQLGYVYILQIRLYWYLGYSWASYKQSHSSGISIFDILYRNIVTFKDEVTVFHNTDPFIMCILSNIKIA